jgi:hypothetical protein
MLILTCAPLAKQKVQHHRDIGMFEVGCGLVLGNASGQDYMHLEQ